MPTAYDFMWLNKIPKSRQWELQHPHRLPATNGLCATVASEQSAARQAPLFTGQGHGLILVSTAQLCIVGFLSALRCERSARYPGCFSNCCSGGSELQRESQSRKFPLYTEQSSHISSYVSWNVCCIDPCLFASQTLPCLVTIPILYLLYYYIKL